MKINEEGQIENKLRMADKLIMIMKKKKKRIKTERQKDNKKIRRKTERLNYD